MIFKIILSMLISLSLGLSFYFSSAFKFLSSKNLLIYFIIATIIVCYIVYVIVDKFLSNKNYNYYSYSKIIFCSLIAMFFISGFINSDFVSKISEREKRNLAEFPNRLPGHELFPREFDKYIDDRVGFRDKMINYHSYIWEKLPFSKVVDEKVKGFVGKDNFLFGNVINETITRYAGIITYSQEQLEYFKYHIDKAVKFYKEKDIKLYVMVPPNKFAVYGENYSPYIKRNTKEPIYKRLDDFLTNNVDEYVPIYRKLLEQKSKYLLYYKEDSHWNSIGAYYAYLELSKKIKEDFPDFKIIEEDDLYRCDAKSVHRDAIPLVPFHKYDYPPTNEFCIKENTDIKNPLKILIVGDSFANISKMTQYFLANFAEVKNYRTYHTSPIAYIKEVEEFKPDIILWEQLITYTENMMNGYITYVHGTSYSYPRSLEEFQKKFSKYIE